MKTYVKPEMIDLSGMETFGECDGNGSGDADQCNANGNNAGATASIGCNGDGSFAEAY
jgi:hypothetical protein